MTGLTSQWRGIREFSKSPLRWYDRLSLESSSIHLFNIPQSIDTNPISTLLSIFSVGKEAQLVFVLVLGYSVICITGRDMFQEGHYILGSGCKLQFLVTDGTCRDDDGKLKLGELEDDDGEGEV